MSNLNAYVVCQINAYLDIRKFIKQYEALTPTWVKSNRYANSRIYAIAWEGLEPNGVIKELMMFLSRYINICQFNKLRADTYSERYEFGYGIDFLCFNESGERLYSLNSYSERMPGWLRIESIVVLPEMPTGEKWRFIKKEV